MPRYTLFAVAALLLTGVGISAHASTPGSNGAIVFTAEVGRARQVFSINPDGTGLRQLTKLTTAPGGPAWSPDGSRILFDAAPAKDRVTLYSMAADGSGLTELPLGVGNFNGAPAWSPDGGLISFDQEPGPSKPTEHSIFVANADGSGAHRLTGIVSRKDYLTHSTWSPDGKHVLFARVKGFRTAALFTIGADGKGLRQLTPWKLDAVTADWSPNGTLIVYSTYWDHHDRQANVFTMKPTGGGVKQLTRYTGRRVDKHDPGVSSFSPSWSPDGKKIVFTRNVPGHGYTDLYTMSANGSQVRQLTHMDRNSHAESPDWGTGH